MIVGLRDIQNQRSAVTLYDPLNRFAPPQRQPVRPVPRPAPRPDDEQFMAQLAELAQVEQGQQQEAGDGDRKSVV